jgi:hypothetical protein
MLTMDQALHRGREAAVKDTERLSAMEAEVSVLRLLLGETAASIQKAAQDIDLVKAAVTEHQMPRARDICALEGEMGRVRNAMAGIGRSLGQQEGEWKAVILDLHQRRIRNRVRFQVPKKRWRTLRGSSSTCGRQLRESATIWWKLCDGTQSWAGGCGKELRRRGSGF